jgi:hypothetical protein
MWIRSSALSLLILFSGGYSGVHAQDMFSSLLRIEQFQAEQGDAEAQFSLAVRYEMGQGVERNMDQAVEWYTKAANGGHAQAQFRLAQLYEKGEGVEKNSVESDAWYAAAASNGHQAAQERIRAINEQAAAPPPAPAKPKPAPPKPVAEKPKPKPKPVAAANPKPKPKPKPKAVAAAKPKPKPVAATAPPKPQVVASAPPPRPAPPPPPPAVVNPAEVLMGARWSGVDGPAPFLPSEVTSCLNSGGEQVLCFSREMKRIVRDSELTFMAKATLGDFKNDGSFRVSYLYNVTDIDEASAPGTTPDASGLRAEQGWQPELVLQCRAQDKQRVRCVRDGYAFDFRGQ